MNVKLINIIIVICLTLDAQCPMLYAQSSTSIEYPASSIKIYLPREVTINDSSLKLGRVCVIMGEESLAAKAGEIILGHFSMTGQKIIVDRSTVLSRLASNGIYSRQVSLLGAEEITVKQQHKVIKSSEFVKLADSFLKKNLSLDQARDGSGRSICRAEPVRIPKDLLLPVMDKDVTLTPRMVESNVANRAKVRISVLVTDQVGDSNEIGAAEVTFRLKFNCRRAVTSSEIPAGTVINPENIKIEETVSDNPEPVSWSPPYGLIARRTLPANTVIQQDMAGHTNPSITIKRNETVVIRIEMPGLLITALGTAMQQGRAGESIKVRNTDSQRIIMAKINEDGTVGPII